MTSKVIWAVFGVAPVLLVITGKLIWWNTVLGPKLRRRMLAQEKLDQDGADERSTEDEFYKVNVHRMGAWGK